MPNTGNMATAMHRIASTGSQEAAGREEIISDLRFEQLVFYVEHNLKQAPETFGEQHLTNVVWGAAKLRLKREPLFNLVQREVPLAVSMRCAWRTGLVWLWSPTCGKLCCCCVTCGGERGCCASCLIERVAGGIRR